MEATTPFFPAQYRIPYLHCPASLPKCQHPPSFRHPASRQQPQWNGSAGTLHGEWTRTEPSAQESQNNPVAVCTEMILIRRPLQIWISLSWKQMLRILFSITTRCYWKTQNNPCGFISVQEGSHPHLIIKCISKVRRGWWALPLGKNSLIWKHLQWRI